MTKTPPTKKTIKKKSTTEKKITLTFTDVGDTIEIKTEGLKGQDIGFILDVVIRCIPDVATNILGEISNNETTYKNCVSEFLIRLAREAQENNPFK